jgi:Zn-dependent membrane protease YugP
MPTGFEAAASVVGRERVRVTRGRDCYHPGTRTVFLSAETWRGSDAGAICRALHEAAHARQHAERPVWFSLRDVRMFRLRIERDAWVRAGKWMRDLGFGPGAMRDEMERGLGTYARRAE